jgi:hypothetical protein
MVGSRRAEEVVDPKLPEKPSSKALKRALLVALRCVDPDSIKRPKMGHVIHMLEAEDLLFREVCFFNSFPSQTLKFTLTSIENPCNTRVEIHGKISVLYNLHFVRFSYLAATTFNIDVMCY